MRLRDPKAVASLWLLNTAQDDYEVLDLAWKQAMDQFKSDVEGNILIGAVDDTAFGPAWNGVTNKVPTQNAVYDAITSIAISSLDDIGDVDATTPSTGNILIWSGTAWTSSSPPFVSDTAYGSGWNGVVDVAPSKNAVYDVVEYLESQIDAISGLVSDAAYDESSWNGVTAVAPSKNAVRDQFEVVASAISSNASAISNVVSNEAYGVGWNGVSTVAPSKGAVYAAIEAALIGAISGLNDLGDVTLTSPTSGQVLSYDGSGWVNTTLGLISDDAYGSGWNGVTAVAPSKNAVYDQIQTLLPLSGGTLTGTVTLEHTNIRLHAKHQQNAQAYVLSSETYSGLARASSSGASYSVLNFYIATGTSSAKEIPVNYTSYFRLMGYSWNGSSWTNGFMFDPRVFNDGLDSYLTIATASSGTIQTVMRVSQTDFIVASGRITMYEASGGIAGYYSRLEYGTLTANRSYTLPDATGTVALTSDVAAAISDTAYDVSWDGVTGIAPSKNAIYDAGFTRKSVAETISAEWVFTTGIELNNAYIQSTQTGDSIVFWNGANGMKFGYGARCNLDFRSAAVYVYADYTWVFYWGKTYLRPYTDNAMDLGSTGLRFKTGWFYTLTASSFNLIEDTAYGISWDGVTTAAPSKNAVYDKIQTLLSLSGGTMSGDITFGSGSGWKFNQADAVVHYLFDEAYLNYEYAHTWYADGAGAVMLAFNFSSASPTTEATRFVGVESVKGGRFFTSAGGSPTTAAYSGIAANTGIYFPTTTSIAFSVGGSIRLYLDSSCIRSAGGLSLGDSSIPFAGAYINLPTSENATHQVVVVNPSTGQLFRDTSARSSTSVFLDDLVAGTRELQFVRGLLYDGSAPACPFVYSFNDAGEPVYEGEIIKNMNGRRKFGQDELELSAPTNKVLIVEEKDEVSYIYTMFLVATTASGKQRTLSCVNVPNLSVRDGSFRRLEKNDELLLEFESLPKNTVSTKLVATGWYRKC